MGASWGASETDTLSTTLGRQKVSGKFALTLPGGELSVAERGRTAGELSRRLPVGPRCFHKNARLRGGHHDDGGEAPSGQRRSTIPRGAVPIAGAVDRPLVARRRWTRAMASPERSPGGEKGRIPSTPRSSVPGTGESLAARRDERARHQVDRGLTVG